MIRWEDTAKLKWLPIRILIELVIYYSFEYNTTHRTFRRNNWWVFLCPKGVGNLNFILYIYLFIPKLIKSDTLTIVKTFLQRDEIYEYESNYSSHFVNNIWKTLVGELMTDQNISVILVLFTIIYWTYLWFFNL